MGCWDLTGESVDCLGGKNRKTFLLAFFLKLTGANLIFIFHISLFYLLSLSARTRLMTMQFIEMAASLSRRKKSWWNIWRWWISLSHRSHWSMREEIKEIWKENIHRKINKKEIWYENEQRGEVGVVERARARLRRRWVKLHFKFFAKAHQQHNNKRRGSTREREEKLVKFFQFSFILLSLFHFTLIESIRMWKYEKLTVKRASTRKKRFWDVPARRKNKRNFHATRKKLFLFSCWW